MKDNLKINKKIGPFNKIIDVEGDKSLSIRWALIASQASGKSKSYNLLKSEDVIDTLNCLKKLGIKVKISKNYCEIIGKGLNGFNYKKKNIILNAGNSGTLGRLILGLLTHSKTKIKIIGDKSLSKRDFLRVTRPLKKFGANFYSKTGKLPITISGTNRPKPIKYFENRGSAQCKSSVMLAALNSPGKTTIKAKKSRDHTEILFKILNIPIKIIKTKKYDYITVTGRKQFKSLDYNIPSDISSSSFFIVLTLLAKNSILTIKNVNINPTRTGIISILNKMGAKIILKNKKKYKGELIADIFVKSAKYLKAIDCPIKYNTKAIDEFLIIFLVAAKSRGISYFKNLQELNQKESKRLDWGSKILNMIGVKTKLTKSSIKIYGQPNLELKKNYKIKNYLKDHRIMAMSTIAALTLGGKWKIDDADSINTSFPSFLKIIRKLGGKYKNEIKKKH